LKSPPAKSTYIFDSTKKTVRIQAKGYLVCHFSDVIRRVRFSVLLALGFASKDGFVLMPMR